MATAQHTLGPWLTTGTGTHNPPSIHADGGAVEIAQIGRNWYPEASDERDANAEFIVRACNCHDELLAALKALVAWMDDNGLSKTKAGGTGPLAYEGTEYSVVRDARTAIAKATE